MKTLNSYLTRRYCLSPTAHFAHGLLKLLAVASAISLSVLSASVQTQAADCVPQPAGLVSWWRAEGTMEDAVGGNHGTTVAAPAFDPGPVGQAFNFDGSNDYVQIPYNANLSSTNYTVEAWVKPAAPLADPEGQDLIFGQGFGLAQLAVRAGTTGLQPRFQFGTGDAVNYPAAVATNDIPLNEYTHLAGVWDGTELKLYVNGLLSAQVTPSRAPVDSQCSFFIGGFNHSGTCAYSGQYFQGVIDEVSYYTRALTNAEIQALYTVGTAGKCMATNPPVLVFPIGPVTNSANGHWYYLVASNTWTGAEAQAVSLGGHLVTLDDAAEDLWVLNTFGSLGGVLRPLWIGLTDSATEGDWVWVSGEAASYRNWMPGEPNNGGGSAPSENYAAMRGPGLTYSDAWNDCVGGEVYVGVVEISPIATQTNCVAPPSGLVGWWRAEGNAEDAVGGLNGSLSGGASFATGMVGQAFSLSGVDGCEVQIGDRPELVMSNAFTAEAWIFPTGAGTGPIGEGIIVNKEGEYELDRRPDGAIRFALKDPNSPMVWTVTPLVAPVGSWTHVALVFDTGAIKVYGNGSLIQSYAGPSVLGDELPTQNDFRIGGRQMLSECFKGLIDEVAVYRRALTAGEIQAIYATGSTGKCPLPSNAPPALVTQPQDQTADAGRNVTFTASVTGTWPFSYQWFFNSAPITGATTLALSLNDVQPAQSGLYSVVITNAYGTVTSSNASLTVLTYPPTITQHPQNVTTYQGRTASFTSKATGTAPLAYQWFYKGDALPSRTTTALALTNVQFGDAGNYWLMATNAYGSAASSNALLTVLPPPVCVSAPTGAIAWWRAESNTLDSASINDATFVYQSPVASSFTAGKVGAAFRLNGGYLSSLAADELNVGAGGGFTVEGWIRPDSISGTKPVFEWNDGRGNIGASLAVYSGTLEAYLTDTNSSPVRRVLLRSPAGAVTNAIWQHVALTFDKTSGIAQVLVNGVSLAQTNLGIFQPQTQSPVYLGYRPTGGYSFMGGLDEFTVYNRPLAPTELQGIITADEAGKCLLPPPPCAAPPAGFVAWWRGESNVLDSVSDNHGLVTPTVVFSNGVAGKAMQFNGGYARIPANDALNVGAGEGFAIEAWVKPTSSSAQPLIQWNNGTGIQGVSLSTYGTMALRANIVDSQGSSHYVTSPSGVLASGIFQHVALTYNKASGTAALYVRGSLVAQVNFTPFTPRTADDLYLGYQPLSSVKFTGALDEVSLYERALTATEIRAIAKARDAGKCFEPPAIVQQPANFQVAEGETAVLSVTAAGNPLLRYQWQFAGTNLSGATRSTLVLTNAQRDQAGFYSVAVTNAAGSITSSNAILTVGPPLAALRVVSTNAAAGETIAVPVMLAANGNENALMFSLSFNPEHLSYDGVVLGGGAPGGSLLFNASQIGSGRLGVAVALPADATFATGTHEVVQVRFTAAALTNDTASPISFGDQPIARQLSDAFYHGLAATYAGGQVAIAAVDYEGDVAPRAGGDHSTTISDWVLAGRYAARLDYPTNASEFQRADSAPRASLGDGAIKITDWVQAGRYAVGLDPLTPVGGPTSEAAGSPRHPKDPPTCRVRAADVVFVQGHAGTLSVLLEAAGNEAGVGFSLAFDPARLSYVSTALGSGASGASLNVNASQAATGKLGLGLMLPTGTSFAAGTQEIVKVTFSAAAAATGNCAVAFSDLPVPRDVSDAGAGTLTASYVSSTVTIHPPPALSIIQQGQDVTLSWPVWATNFALQTVEGGMPLTGPWTNVVVTPGSSNGENVITLPLSGAAKFYRLRQP